MVSMRVFICSLMRCLSSPWRDISHTMSSGRMSFLRLALRAGALVASSSRSWYSFPLVVPFNQAFVSPQARCVSFAASTVVVIVLCLAGLEALAGRSRRLGRPRLHGLLEQHVEEQEHRLRLQHQRARRLPAPRSGP